MLIPVVIVKCATVDFPGLRINGRLHLDVVSYSEADNQGLYRSLLNQACQVV